MHKKNLFHTIYLSFSFLLFLFGLCLTGIFFKPDLNLKIIELLSEKKTLFANLGLSFIFLSMFLWWGLFSLSRSTALSIKVPGVVVEAAPELISGFLEKHLKALFQDLEFSFGVMVEDDHLEITAYIPNLKKNKEPLFFKMLKKEVKNVLKKHFFYKKDFQLSVLRK